MSLFTKFNQTPKNRKLGIAIALLTSVMPIPLAGIHKFYLNQPIWGVIYFLLWNTPIPRIACAIDAVWYFVQGEEQFNRQFNLMGSPLSAIETTEAQRVTIMAQALRELDQLREEGLVSEYEFEQKRRQLLEE